MKKVRVNTNLKKSYNYIDKNRSCYNNIHENDAILLAGAETLGLQNTVNKNNNYF